MAKRARASALPKSAMFDSLENFVTGMGTVQDKSTFTRFATILMDRNQSEIAYRSDWIARKVIDIPANDATREWRTWQADNDDITLIEEAESHFKVKHKINNAMKRGRLYGGGAIIMGVNQGTSEQALDVEKVQKDDLKFIHVVSRHDLTIADINRNPLDEFFGEPTMYTVNAAGTGVSNRIHPSRVIRFLGNPMPDPISATNGIEVGWSDSCLQIVADAIKTCGTVAQSGAGLVQDGQVDVIKMPDMTANMALAGYEKNLVARFANAAMIKSQYGFLLMDKDEEWDRIESQLGGLSDLVKVYLLIASGACDIPATRMLGQSPQGMSATGESDIRNYYDMVRSGQNNDLSPTIEVLDEVLLRSIFGDKPEGIFYNWNSLWQMTDEQRADLSAKKGATFKIDVDSGLFPDSVLREARINQLVESGDYPGFDLIIQEAEAAGEFDEHDNAKIEAEAAAQEALMNGPKALPGQEDPEDIDDSYDYSFADAWDPSQPRLPAGHPDGGKWKPAVLKTAEELEAEKKAIKKEGLDAGLLRIREYRKELKTQGMSKEAREQKMELLKEALLHRHGALVAKGSLKRAAQAEADLKKLGVTVSSAMSAHTPINAAIAAEVKNVVSANPPQIAGQKFTPEETASFNDMVKMLGGTPAAVSQAKSYFQAAKNKSLAGSIKHYEAAHIMAYTGSHFVQTNTALRSGVMTEARWNHVKQLNDALDKLPAYKGTTYRKTNISVDKLGSMYPVGSIVEERGFTSTSKESDKWSGNVQYTISSKNGRDVSRLSVHPGEKEVLFKSGTRFKVTGSKIGGNIHGISTINLEEV